MIDQLKEERNRLDQQLDDALHTFAEYEEGMNVRWQTADANGRQDLMAERSRVEEELGIVTIVLRLDEIREALDAAEASRLG
ncbi:hypothetical protein CU669_06635 [Paramagnetospirillum kuznetsovii]|uniref:Uncharacterized protein n=1 Tax=Paramagnetospirillum kuznetsovii TaxID=2053833 RepID=A0A364P157_9PROT|nr:hypothetical protein CU669_06635 [Paramagnetospirillum kuznetsovii]